MITMNMVIEKCYQLALTHPQINGFGYGPIYDIGGQEIEYPYLWIVNEDSHTFEISEDGNNFSSLEYVLQFRVADKVNNQPNVYSANGQNSNNGLEIISDTLSILIDIIEDINSTGNLGGISLKEDVDIEPFFHEDSGDVNGHTGYVTLRVMNEQKPC